jgi:diadenosine tetraphosphatase ApaH/serine/threonine PP2A family protein phosphatase
VNCVVVSDVHGNLEALLAVKSKVEDIAPDKVIFLGDAVGYGAAPNECIEVLQGMTEVMIAGNHDFGAVDMTDTRLFNPIAREAIDWTAGALTPENRAFLKERPLTHTEGAEIRAVHATPFEPESWHYILSPNHALVEFEHFEEALCFIGHSHQPVIFELKDAETIVSRTDAMKIEPGRRYIVNVGSVGQPRDHDPRACLCVCDMRAGELRIERVEYDIEAAKKRILDAGLPPVLANRLSWGE